MVFPALDFLVIIISSLNQMANLVQLVLTGYTSGNAIFSCAGVAQRLPSE